MINEKKYVRTDRYYRHDNQISYNRAKVRRFSGYKLGYGKKAKSNPLWWIYDGPLKTRNQKKLGRYLYRVILKFEGKPVDELYKFLETRLPDSSWKDYPVNRVWSHFILQDGKIYKKSRRF